MAASDDSKTVAIPATNFSPGPTAKTNPSAGSSSTPRSPFQPTEVIRQLGEGGMGEVFLCLNPHYGVGTTNVPREVAVKTLSPELNQDKELLRRFEAEAKALSPIEHRNVVRLFDWGIFETGPKVGQHFISMEFIQGVSLHRLSRSKRLSFPDLLDFATQIAEGLAAVHRSNVLHRDLKPANIMITNDGVVKIIDFGIAKPTSLAGEAESTERGFKTKTGIIIGTVNYLAPEMLLGAPATVQTDLYALGLIIWESLNGATPFKSNSLAETMKRVSEENLKWSETIIDIAPSGFIKLLNQLTAKDPSKRIQSAEDLAERLRKIQADAKWPAALNRKTRLDLEFSWAKETFELLSSKSVSEEDYPYVLQCAEDLLIRNKDSRVKSSASVILDDTLITQAMQAFQSARYEAAMARQARLKADILSGERVKAGPANSLGRPPVKPLAIERRDSVRQNPSGGPSGIPSLAPGNANHQAKESSHLGLKFVIGSFLTAAFTYISFNYIQGIRSQIQSTEQASTGQLPNIVVPNISRQNAILESFGAWKTGTRLIYETELTSPNKEKRELQQRLEIAKIEAGRVHWQTEDNRTVSMPITLIPLDAIFEGAILRHANRIERSDLLEPHRLLSQRNFAFDLSSPDGSDRDRTACRVSGQSPITVFGKEQLAIEISCNRESFKAGQIAHRGEELYRFASSSGVMIETSSKTENYDSNGALMSTSSKSSKLNELFSYVRSN
jgi:serine/threonine protein kinase